MLFKLVKILAESLSKEDRHVLHGLMAQLSSDTQEIQRTPADNIYISNARRGLSTTALAIHAVYDRHNIKYYIHLFYLFPFILFLFTFLFLFLNFL